MLKDKIENLENKKHIRNTQRQENFQWLHKELIEARIEFRVHGWSFILSKTNSELRTHQQTQIQVDYGMFVSNRQDFEFSDREEVLDFIAEWFVN